MVDAQEILRVVERKGPIIPTQIMREVGSDTITIGALLSELSHAGKIKISHVKIGGTPAYYTSNQAMQLQELSKYLNEKDQKAFELLKQRKVLRDKVQEPIIRVALRNIKDYSRMLEVKTKDGDEIYWKWYLLDNKEAEKLIIANLKGKPVQPSKLEKIKAAEKPKAKQTQLSKTKVTKKSPAKDDKFSEKVKRFFEQNRIIVEEEDVKRKNSEIDFIIKVPSPLGHQEYYCNAKNKKKCNDGDLSSAYVKGQAEKLPVIFLTTGEVTNKARDMLSKEFKGLILKKI